MILIFRQSICRLADEILTPKLSPQLSLIRFIKIVAKIVHKIVYKVVISDPQVVDPTITLKKTTIPKLRQTKKKNTQKFKGGGREPRCTYQII